VIVQADLEFDLDAMDLTEKIVLNHTMVAGGPGGSSAKRNRGEVNTFLQVVKGVVLDNKVYNGSSVDCINDDPGAVTLVHVCTFNAGIGISKRVVLDGDISKRNSGIKVKKNRLAASTAALL
jgi:hypothetical protein